ncbi:hypothetical protein CSKR_106140, partial [Clonorchis sinensis]
WGDFGFAKLTYLDAYRLQLDERMNYSTAISERTRAVEQMRRNVLNIQKFLRQHGLM